MAELADALDSGSSGQPWGFKSLYPHQSRQRLNPIYLFVNGVAGFIFAR